LEDSIADWRRETEKLFKEHCDKFAAAMQKNIEEQVARGIIVKIDRTKGGPPLDLRYEWAANRYCMRKRYKDMVTTAYGEALIRQTVHRILKEVQLKSVT
jgi:hypothetical protein